MGYTTKFTGAIDLSRKLTMAEAKELLEIAASDEAEKITGIRAYFQWVPAETLQHIVWDGNEKFYEYVPQLEWLCGWLNGRGITANGILSWSGEDTSDRGTITVTANVVTAQAKAKTSGKALKPLCLRDLQEMALEQIAGAQ